MPEQDPAPSLDRTITGTRLAASEDFSCCICVETLVDPVTVECGHTFCRHCISTCFGQVVTSFRETDDAQRPRIACPRCRGDIAVHYEVSASVTEAMWERELLRAQRPGACVAKAATVNRSDGNRTETDGWFDIVFGASDTGADVPAGAEAEATPFEADVVWSRGTVHSTYRETTCRVRGSLTSSTGPLVRGWLRNGLAGGVAGGDAAEGQQGGALLTAHPDYSNGPWEEWSGRVVEVPGSAGPVFELRDGKYVWHGWNGRTSRGALELTWVRRRTEFREVP